MSNALAIAGVSAVLKDLLDSGVIDHQVTDVLGAGVTVSSLAPDVVPIDGDAAAPRLNLFLYQVTHNAAWRNVDLPSRGASGHRISNPPLALDLHYLLTAYGITDRHGNSLNFDYSVMLNTEAIGIDSIAEAAVFVWDGNVTYIDSFIDGTNQAALTGTIEFILGAGETKLILAQGVDVFGEAAAVIPVPAAVWLFGSGLLGLVGVARRKQAA